jgi:hypothetical protein
MKRNKLLLEYVIHKRIRDKLSKQESTNHFNANPITQDEAKKKRVEQMILDRASVLE